MNTMLDTNICIYLIKYQPSEMLEHLSTLKPTEVCLSAITVAELHHGVANSQHPIQNAKALASFTQVLQILPFDEQAALYYGKLRNDLERQGISINPLDLMIASHALSVGSKLVTNNEQKFKDIPHLHLENWGAQTVL